MRLNYLIIDGYVCLTSNGVNHFEWRPSEGITGILGSNGSGKSAIMRVAAPLAGTRNLFNEDGKVQAGYENDGIEYLVGYRVEKDKLIHFFYIGDEDGENLNRGGTGKEQDDLALQIFGYSKTIHQCLTGKLRFSSLGPAKRAQLLQEVVSIDVSEAERVYESLAVRYRDLQGSHSHISSKIIGYQDTILDEEQCAKHQEVIQSCIAGVEFLREKATTKPVSGEALAMAAFEAAIERIGEVSTEVLKEKPIVDLSFPVNEDLGYTLTKQHAELVHLKKVLSDDSTEYLELEASIGEGDVDYTKLKNDAVASIADIKVQMQEFDEPTLDGVSDEEVPTLVALTENFYHLVNNTMPSGQDSGVTKENAQLKAFHQLESELTEAKNELVGLTSKEEAGTRWLVRVENADKERCPKCMHEYWRDFSVDDVARIKKSLTELGEYRPKLVAKIEDLTTRCVAVESFRNAVQTILTAADALPDWLMGTVYHMFHDGGEYHSDVFYRQLIVGKVASLLKRLRNMEEYVGLKKKLSYNEELIAKVDAMVGGGVLEKLSQRSFDLKKRIANHAEEIEFTTARVKELEAYITARDKYLNWEKQLNHYVNTALEASETLFSIYDFDCNETSYRAIQKQLAVSNEMINSNASTLLLLKESKADLEVVNKEMHRLKVLMKSLSPQTGMIARELTNGINQFTGMMNSMLSEVWEYSMEFLPCDLEKGKLTYRFPVRIKHVGGLKDINEGSDGQRQIVDFVFSMLYIAQKGLREFPLILDEPGTGLDHKHLDIFFNYIRRLAEDRFCSQIFLISHVFGIMGDFGDIDLIVMDEDNVSGLNGLVYNTNVIMS